MQKSVVGTPTQVQNSHKAGDAKIASIKFGKKNDLPAVRKQLKNYERMKLLMQKWIDLAMELSILRLAKKLTE